MLKELLFIMVILGLAWLVYNAMKPDEKCYVQITKPDGVNGTNNTTVFPKVLAQCERVVQVVQ